MKLFQTQQALELITNGLCDPSNSEEMIQTFLPTRATKQSAGYDIRACLLEPCTIFAGETVKVPTGFHLQTDNPSIVGKLYVRSSIGNKKGLRLANGTGIIDADYPDQWFVCLHNFRTTAVTIEQGERIAQVVFTPVVHLQELQEHSLDEERVGGIGSTNKLQTVIETAYEAGVIK